MAEKDTSKMKYIPSNAIEHHERVRMPRMNLITLMNNFLKLEG
jgi:hypothetical protein